MIYIKTKKKCFVALCLVGILAVVLAGTLVACSSKLNDTVYYCFELTEEESDLLSAYRDTREEQFLKDLTHEQLLKLWLQCLKERDFNTQYYLYNLENDIIDREHDPFTEEKYVEAFEEGLAQTAGEKFRKVLNIEDFPIKSDLFALRIISRDEDDPFLFVFSKSSEGIWKIRPEPFDFEENLRYAIRIGEVEKAYQNAVKALYWFEVYTLAGDFSTSREAGGAYYFKVKHETIKTYADLENYLHSLFADNIVSDLLGYGRYRDFDGALYAVCADRGTDCLKGKETLDILWESDVKFRCTVQVELLDAKDFTTVTGYETHEFYYECLEGKWVFTNFYLFR